MCRAAEKIAREFYETYERLAGHEPRDAEPDIDRALMLATAQELLDRGLIATGEQVW